MVNNLVLTGRIASDFQIVTLESGKKVTEITIAVQRNFKNFEGKYEVDYFKATLWDGLANTVGTYCVKGSMISLVGRLQIRQTHIDERKINIIEIIAENIGFLDKKTQPNKDASSVVTEETNETWYLTN